MKKSNFKPSVEGEVTANRDRKIIYTDAMLYSRLVEPSRHGTDKATSRRSGRLVDPSRS